MTQSQTNPRRPPRQWMRDCVRGVKESGSAANPGAVCGSLWYHKMSAAQRREALAREKVRDNPRARRYHVVDQVQKGLWQQVGYFLDKQDAERMRGNLSGETRIVHTYPSARNAQPQWKKLADNPDELEPATLRSPPVEISQAPLSSGDKTVLWSGALALLAAFAWWAFKPEEASAAGSAPSAPTPAPTGPLPPAVTCDIDTNKLEAWAKQRGFYAVFIELKAWPDYDEIKPSLKAQPLPLLLVATDDDYSFWTYDFAQKPNGTMIVSRDDLRADYCVTASS